jgi:hypothetical protein
MSLADRGNATRRLVDDSTHNVDSVYETTSPIRMERAMADSATTKRSRTARFLARLLVHADATFYGVGVILLAITTLVVKLLRERLT